MKKETDPTNEGERDFRELLEERFGPNLVVDSVEIDHSRLNQIYVQLKQPYTREFLNQVLLAGLYKFLKTVDPKIHTTCSEKGDETIEAKKILVSHLRVGKIDEYPLISDIESIFKQDFEVNDLGISDKDSLSSFRGINLEPNQVFVMINAIGDMGVGDLHRPSFVTHIYSGDDCSCQIIIFKQDQYCEN